MKFWFLFFIWQISSWHLSLTFLCTGDRAVKRRRAFQPDTSQTSELDKRKNMRKMLEISVVEIPNCLFLSILLTRPKNAKIFLLWETLSFLRAKRNRRRDTDAETQWNFRTSRVSQASFPFPPLFPQEWGRSEKKSLFRLKNFFKNSQHFRENSNPSLAKNDCSFGQEKVFWEA